MILSDDAGDQGAGPVQALRQGRGSLKDLNLEVAEGEVVGYLTTTVRLVLGLVRPTAGSSQIYGLDSQLKTAQAHRRLADVPGEASLWPSLTGAETLHLLGRVQGRVDPTYRDELIERFELDPSKKVRAYSKGNRQTVMLIAGLMTRADPAASSAPTPNRSRRPSDPASADATRPRQRPRPVTVTHRVSPARRFWSSASTGSRGRSASNRCASSGEWLPPRASHGPSS